MVPTAGAGEPRVAICHATASATNPYTRITVNVSSVDGADDRGPGDHFAEHQGPVGPTADGRWGDIIPPVPGVHDGLNWSGDGESIWLNGCQLPSSDEEPGDDGSGGGLFF